MLRSLIAVATVALCLGAIGSASAATDPAPGWLSLSPPSQPRTGQFAALLGTGNILVGGGRAGSTTLASTQQYSPATDTWLPSASMLSGRENATATSLADGRVFVAGGSAGPCCVADQTEVYDPVKNTWSATSQCCFGWVGHTAVRLTGGSVLLAGGQESGGMSFPFAQMYDPAADQWRFLDDMKVSRASATATLLKSGRVLMAGGTLPDGSSTTSVEVFNPATQAWGLVAPMGLARAGHTATLLADGRVLVTGGYTAPGSATTSAELYDPVADKWSPATSMQQARAGHAATRLYNGDVLITAGDFPRGNSSSEVYSAATNTWTGWYMGTGSRWDVTTLALPDGRVLAIGGSGTYEPAQSTMRFVPTTTFSLGASVWDLGSEPVGSAGPLRQLTVTNTGTNPLLLSELTMTGVSAGEFKVQAGGCGSAAVLPGASCQLGLRFAPTAGGQRRATLSFKANRSGPLTPSVDVKGLGTTVIPAPTATPDPEPSVQPAPPVATTVATAAPTPPTKVKPAAKDATLVFQKAYRVAARLRGSYCHGRVALELRRGKATLAKRTAKLDAKCRFGATFKVAWSRLGTAKTLTVVARFRGNAHLGATTNRFVVPVPRRG